MSGRYRPSDRSRLGRFPKSASPMRAHDSRLDTQRKCSLHSRRRSAKAPARVFYALAKLYDGQDHFYRAALNIACGTDPARRDAILADFDKHFPEWNDKVADLVWELRPKSVLPRLGKLLADPKLTPAQKGRIVDILAVNDDPAAGKTHARRCSAATSPPEVKARALENLRLFLPTKWNDLTQGDELRGGHRRSARRPRTHQIAGLQLVAARRTAATVDDVIGLARDDKAAARRPHRGGPDARQASGRRRRVDALIELGVPQNPLSVECGQGARRSAADRAEVHAGTRSGRWTRCKLAIELPRAPPEIKQAALDGARRHPAGHRLAARSSQEQKQAAGGPRRRRRPAAAEQPVPGRAQQGPAPLPRPRQARPEEAAAARRTGEAATATPKRGKADSWPPASRARRSA